MTQSYNIPQTLKNVPDERGKNIELLVEKVSSRMPETGLNDKAVIRFNDAINALYPNLTKPFKANATITKKDLEKLLSALDIDYPNAERGRW